MQKYLIVIINLLALVSAFDFACQKFILNLTITYVQNKTQFFKQMLPYLAYSGKSLDDLGFPTVCQKQQSNKYSTVQIKVNQEFEYTFYYGFCFTSSCSTQQLNKYGAQIINNILQKQLQMNHTIQFYEPSLQNYITISAILMYIVFSIIILIGMLASIKKWIKAAKNDEDQQDDSHPFSIRLDEDVDHEQQVQQLEFIEKISLERKFALLQTRQSSTKILSFSWFKIFAIPMLIFGEIFYLNNYGSYNYFSFSNEIYDSFLSKVALTAYYIPDVFFFISGYLVAGKLLGYNNQNQNLVVYIQKVFTDKLKRLYPLYIVVIIIYWLISPTLHSGPVWFVYQQEAQVCNYGWWRVIFLIDNWWKDSCYSPAWFVQVQIQLLIISCIFFLLYHKKRTTSFIFLIFISLVFWILMLTLSAPLPSSVQTILAGNTQQFFKATYSRAPFYLLGTFFAILSVQQNIREMVQKYILNGGVILILYLISFGILIVILLKPDIWGNFLGLQLSLCRIGVIISFIIIFLKGMFWTTSKVTIAHKVAALSYPIILISGVVTMSEFWCNSTFPYLSMESIFRNTIPSVAISLVIGTFLGLLFSLLK